MCNESGHPRQVEEKSKNLLEKKSRTMRFSVSIHYDQSEGVDPLSRKQEGIECSAPEEKSKAQLETLPVARLSSDDTQQKIRPIVWFLKKKIEKPAAGTLCAGISLLLCLGTENPRKLPVVPRRRRGGGGADPHKNAHGGPHTRNVCCALS